MAKVERIYGNTFCIKTSSMCIPFYLIRDGEVILIDSGLVSEREEIGQVLNGAGLKVRAILTSHAHYDHMGSHLYLRERDGAEIYMSVFDAGACSSLLTLQTSFPTWRLEEVAARYPFMVCPADHMIRPGDREISVNGVQFQILNLPGHAYSHLGFVTPDGVAYVGDLLVGEADLTQISLIFCQCWEENLRSMDRICGTDYPVYVMAHGGVTTDVQEAVAVNKQAFGKQAEWVLSMMDSWISRAELTGTMAAQRGRRVSREKLCQIARITNAMLDYFESTGLVESQVTDSMEYYRRKPEFAAVLPSPEVS